MLHKRHEIGGVGLIFGDMYDVWTSFGGPGARTRSRVYPQVVPCSQLFSPVGDPWIVLQKPSALTFPRAAPQRLLYVLPAYLFTRQISGLVGRLVAGPLSRRQYAPVSTAR